MKFKLLALLLLLAAVQVQAQTYIEDVGDKLVVVSGSNRQRLDKARIGSVELVGERGIRISGVAPFGRSAAIDYNDIDTTLFVESNSLADYPPLNSRANVRNWILVAAGRQVWRSDDKQPVATSEYTADTVEGFDTVAAVRYQYLVINSTADTVLVTPPATPKRGEWFGVIRSRSAATHPIYVDLSTQKLFAASSDATLTGGVMAKFIYYNSTVGWIRED